MPEEGGKVGVGASTGYRKQTGSWEPGKEGGMQARRDKEGVGQRLDSTPSGREGQCCRYLSNQDGGLGDELMREAWPSLSNSKRESTHHRG